MSSRLSFSASRLLAGWLSLLLCASAVEANQSDEAWLRYLPIADSKARERYDELPSVVVVLGDSDVLRAGQEELVRGVRGMLGRTLRTSDQMLAERAIVLGTFKEVQKAIPSVRTLPKLHDDGFWLATVEDDGRTHLVVTAPNERGVLYGAFALLRTIGLHESTSQLNVHEQPHAPLRCLYHADSDADSDADAGGQSESSLFWNDGRLTNDVGRSRDYARKMASVGLNGCAIGDVRNGVQMLSGERLREAARLANALRPWGVRLYLAVDFASPEQVGRATTSDPQSDAVRDFWRRTCETVYREIPDLGGFVLEVGIAGRARPSDYGRTHADAANVVAEALAAHGGTLLYRTSVEVDSAKPDDPRRDPAKTSFEELQPLDGAFADNVVVQIKHSAIDIRQTALVSPLIGEMKKTNQALELQASQARLGHGRQLSFLVPLWRQVLDFDLMADDDSTFVKELVAGKTYERPTGGMIAIVDVEYDGRQLGHHLTMSNLFGFGRVAWDPELKSKQIAEQWTRLSFGHDARVVGTIVDMLLSSRSVYEQYTGGSLGAGTCLDCSEASNSADASAWLQADSQGIGVDRTTQSGSGFIAQYSAGVARIYESLETCPDELLLHLHHVPYTHVLPSGETVIQRLYDANYQGAREARRMVNAWQSLEGRVDAERYQTVLDCLTYQAAHALVWRDANCIRLLQRSGITDDKERVGNDPRRSEAESMELVGYEAQDVVPWETASGGQCAACTSDDRRGSLRFAYEGKSGWYDVTTVYFDENDGASRYELWVGAQLVDEWVADETLRGSRPNGLTSTRRQTRGVALRPGDEIRLEVTADGGEQACVDYFRINAAD